MIPLWIQTKFLKTIRGFQQMGPDPKDAVLLAFGSQFSEREPTIALSFAPKH